MGATSGGRPAKASGEPALAAATDYRSRRGAKSNPCLAWAGLSRDQAGQTTVEYMLLVAVLVVALALSLDVVPSALAELLNGLGELLGRTYP